MSSLFVEEAETAAGDVVVRKKPQTL
jgi:hypothetical protein